MGSWSIYHSLGGIPAPRGPNDAFEVAVSQYTWRIPQPQEQLEYSSAYPDTPAQIRELYRDHGAGVYIKTDVASPVFQGSPYPDCIHR
jgi:hypothetical protein